jgi:FAD/FMN-containing dehydrogenase/Fe-S oxidoreductase
MADRTFDDLHPPFFGFRNINPEHPPLLPPRSAEDRIDLHDRHLHGDEWTTVEEDLMGAPLGLRRKSFRNPPPFPDADVMAARLQREIAGEVRFDAGTRAMYATDASNYRQVPIGVVLPKSVEDVVKTVAIAREFGAPILSRGGGTSLAGQCCNTAVVMDMSKYLNQVLEVNAHERWVRVRPGIVLDQLREALLPTGLTFGPDPATHSHCTLGGMIGNNSCGMHAQMAGRTEHNVLELEVLLYDGTRLRVGATSDAMLKAKMAQADREGEIYRSLKTLRDRYADLVRGIFPDIPRKVSGYNLDNLLPEKGFHLARALVGTESTCVVVLEARLKLVPNPTHRALVILGFRDIATAADHVLEVLKHNPIAFEGMDFTLIDHMKRKGLEKEDIRLLPVGHGWLVIEFGEFSEAALQGKLATFSEAAKGFRDHPDLRVIDDPHLQKRIWKIREDGLGATARVPGERETWEGWEDSAVAPKALGAYLRELQKLYAKYGYTGALYGHFGQGCVHTRIDFDLLTREGILKYREFVHEAAHLVVKHGGSLSGEHGDGQSRGELLPIMFGAELVEAFRQFKRIWDPDWKMNPGKVVDPYRVDQNLRIGTEYDPPDWKTKFHFPEDHGSFARASTRCVGVGACRREKGGVMCPSYMVTREEKHSTRGRARLLFEMLEGAPLKRTWREKAVREALDLCLACKGCKGDCPMNVDMATYKAEFFHHYYKGRLRPLAAYSMGLIYWWARLASFFPRLINWAFQTRVLSTVLKRLGGIATERKLPLFARTDFRSWFYRRSVVNAEGSQVVLWVDTFNNHFHPDVARAACEFLEAAGFRVLVPPAKLCCGRPLYDFGLLNLAQAKLGQILREMKEVISEGVPVVGLEPSCTAVFRDELKGLFPHRYDAERLRLQTYLLPEFITEFPEHFDRLIERAKNRAPASASPQGQKLLLHVHCHQHAVIGATSDIKVLARLGFDVERLDSGCCGMAGSFGFEKEHVEISKQIAERVLAPAVRAAPEDTLIVTNGFSCREQIEQVAGRRPLHIAELLHRVCVQEV